MSSCWDCGVATARQEVTGRRITAVPAPPKVTPRQGRQVRRISMHSLLIPRSRDNPEFRWVYDTEIVRDLIAPLAPVRWHVLAQESQHRDTEILERGVALVVGGVSVHQSP